MLEKLQKLRVRKCENWDNYGDVVNSTVDVKNMLYGLSDIAHGGIIPWEGFYDF